MAAWLPPAWVQAWWTSITNRWNGCTPAARIIFTSLQELHQKVDTIMTTEKDLQTDMDLLLQGVSQATDLITSQQTAIKNLTAQVASGTPVTQEQLDGLHAEAQSILTKLANALTGAPPAPAVTPSDPPPSSSPVGSGDGAGSTVGAVPTPVPSTGSEVPAGATTEPAGQPDSGSGSGSPAGGDAEAVPAAEVPAEVPAGDVPAGDVPATT